MEPAVSPDTLIYDLGSQRLTFGLASAALREAESPPTWPRTIPVIAGRPRFRASFPFTSGGGGLAASASSDLLYTGYDACPLLVPPTAASREYGGGRGLLKLSYPVRSGHVVDEAAAVLLLRQATSAALAPARHGHPHARPGGGAGGAGVVGVRAAAQRMEAAAQEDRMRDREALAAAAASAEGGVFATIRAEASLPSNPIGERKVRAAMVEHPFASRAQRARLAELLFETDGYDDTQEAADNAARSTTLSTSPHPVYAPRTGVVEGLFCGVAPLLALYGTGRTTGVAVEVGDAVVSTACAVAGRALTPAMQRSDGAAAGNAVTEYLHRLLRVHSGSVGGSGGRGSCSGNGVGSAGAQLLGSGSTAEKELVRDIKERCCRVLPRSPYVDTPGSPTSSSSMPAHTVTRATVRGSTSGLVAAAQQRRRDALRRLDAAIAQEAASGGEAACTYPLPDGSHLHIGSVPALEAAEVHFTPGIAGHGDDTPGVVDVILSTVQHPSIVDDLSTRSLLLSSVALSGGATLLSGFAARLRDELQAVTPAAARVAVLAPRERGHAAWLGAAFLSQLSTFPSMCVSREEYLEDGESALHARLFQ